MTARPTCRAVFLSRARAHALGRVSGLALAAGLGLGPPAFGDGTVLDSGTLTISNDNQLAPGDLTLNGGTLELAGNVQSARSIILGTRDLSILLLDLGTASEFSGPISGAGALEISGPGVLTLSGDSDKTGGLSIGTFGRPGPTTVIAKTDAAFGTGSVWVGDEGKLVLDPASGGSLTLVNPVTLTDAAGATNGPGGAVIPAGALVNLEGANTITGPIAVATAGGPAQATITTASGSLTLAGSVGIPPNNIYLLPDYLTIDGAGDTTISGTIESTITGGITKTGSGTLTLTGANTYSGGTTLDAGALAISGDANLGAQSGGLTLNGGTLRLSGGTNVQPGGTLMSRNVTLGGAATLETDSSTWLLDGTISGPGSLTKTGNGVLMLYGANAYTGGTALNGGVIYALNSSALGAGAVSVAQATTLGFYAPSGGAINVANALTLSGMGDTFDFGKGPVSGGALFNYQATTALNGPVTLVGQVLINNAWGTAPTITDGYVYPTLAINGAISGRSDASLIVGGGGPTAINGVIDGGVTGGVTLNGGYLELGGTNAYTGGTTINSGTLVVSSDVNLGNASGGVILNGGTLELTAGLTTSRPIVTNGPAAVRFESGTSIFSGPISGSGSLSTGGAGTLVLSGNNSFSGGSTFANHVVVETGTALGTGPADAADLTLAPLGAGFSLANALRLSGSLSNASGQNTLSGPVTLSGGVSILTDAGSLTLSGPISGESPASLSVGGNGGSTTISGDIESSVTGGFFKGGLGTVTLSGHNTYQGGTSVNNGSLIAVGPAALGNGTILVASGGTLAIDATSPATYGNPLTLSGTGDPARGSNGALYLQSGNAALTGVITLQGNTRINADDPTGTLVLSGPILGTADTTPTLTFGGTGNTAVRGTISDSPRPAGGGGDFGGGVTIIFGGCNNNCVGICVGSGTSFPLPPLPVGIPRGNGIADLGSDAPTVESIGLTPLSLMAATVADPSEPAAAAPELNLIAPVSSEVAPANQSFALTLVKDGSGALTLTGSNTYTGGTVLDAGTLVISSDANLGAPSGGLMLNGGTLELAGNVISTRPILLGTGGFPEIAADVGTASVLSGTISGSGQLNVAGSGTLTLSGSNLYTGGTVLFSGTTVARTSAALGPGAVAIDYGATLVLDPSGSGITLSNVRSLGGDVGEAEPLVSGVPAAEGALVSRSGANSLTGPLTLYGAPTITTEAGTLTLSGPIGGGFTFSGPITTGDAGYSSRPSLTVAGAGTTVISSVIGATVTGGVTKTGAGTLILSGANTYTGGTLIEAGTLALGADNALPTGGVLTLTGGTFDLAGHSQTIGGLQGSGGAVSLDPAVLTIDQATDRTYGGAISGPGALVKSGSGTLTLAGANTYTGGTTLSGGTLAVANPTALGQGSVTVSGGVLTVGGGNQTIVVHGDYLQTGGTLALPGSGDRLMVAGSATLGGTLEVDSTRSVGAGQHPLGMIEASQVAGQFGAIVDSNGQPILVVYSGTVALIGQEALAPLANKPEQPVAAAIDRAFPTSSGDFVDVVAALDGFAPGQPLSAALDQLSPLRFQLFQEAAFDRAGFLAQSVLDAAARGGTTGFDLADLQIQRRGESPLAFQMRNALASLAATPLAPGVPASDDGSPTSSDAGRWTGFVSGTVILADIDQSTVAQKSNYTSSGLLAGVAYRLTDSLRVGLLFDYAHTDARLDAEGSRAAIDSYAPGLFAAWRSGGAHAGAVFAFGTDDYATNRRILFGSIDRRARGESTGQSPVVALGGGYDWSADAMRYGPVASAIYSHLGVDPFGETGAGSIDLSVGNETADSLRTRLGGHVGAAVAMDGVSLRPDVALAWQHEFKAGPTPIAAGFAEPGGGDFSVATAGPARNAVFADATLVASFDQGPALFVSYQLQGGNGETAQNVTAGLRLAF